MRQKRSLFKLVVLIILGLLVSGCGGGGGKTVNDADYSAEVNEFLDEFIAAVEEKELELVLDFFAEPTTIDGVERDRLDISAWLTHMFDDSDYTLAITGTVALAGKTANVVIAATNTESEIIRYVMTLQRIEGSWFITVVRELTSDATDGSVTLSWENSAGSLFDFDLCVQEPGFPIPTCADVDLITANGFFDRNAGADGNTSETYTWDEGAAAGDYVFSVQFVGDCEDWDSEALSPAASLIICVGGEIYNYTIPPLEPSEISWPFYVVNLPSGEVSVAKY